MSTETDDFHSVDVHLSDPEWMSLVDGSHDATDHNLETCCGDIDELRSLAVCFAASRGKDIWRTLARDFANAVAQARKTHSITQPAILRLEEQFRVAFPDLSEDQP